MTEELQVRVEPLVALPPAARQEAREILLGRFGQTNRSAAHNRSLIHRLFSASSFHCHRAGRAVSTTGFSLALGFTEARRCVAVGVHRHVPPPRRAADARGGFTELLLLAVHAEYERRGHGRAIVAAVLRDSLQNGSKQLFVVSTGHAFWKQPAFCLPSMGGPASCGFPIFVPWSCGIEIIGREVTRQAADEIDAVCAAAAARKRLRALEPRAALRVDKVVEERSKNPSHAASNRKCETATATVTDRDDFSDTASDPGCEDDGQIQLHKTAAFTAAPGRITRRQRAQMLVKAGRKSASAPQACLQGDKQTGSSMSGRKRPLEETAPLTPVRERPRYPESSSTTVFRTSRRTKHVPFAVGNASPQAAAAPTATGQPGTSVGEEKELEASGPSSTGPPTPYRSARLRLQALAAACEEASELRDTGTQAPAVVTLPAAGASSTARVRAQASWKRQAKTACGRSHKKRSRAALSCRGCGSADTRWRSASNGGTLCAPCRGRWVRREYCPVCEHFWSDRGKDASMLQCDKCDVWVHARCEGIPPSAVAIWGELPYSCAECRGARPGEGLAQPARPAAGPCSRCGTSSLVNFVAVPKRGEIPLCTDCASRWARLEFCPVCCELWKEPLSEDVDGEVEAAYEEDMVQCDACELWVHTACEDLLPDVILQLASRSYFCPDCRKLAPGVHAMGTEASEGWCRELGDEQTNDGRGGEPKDCEPTSTTMSADHSHLSHACQQLADDDGPEAATMPGPSDCDRMNASDQDRPLDMVPSYSEAYLPPTRAGSPSSTVSTNVVSNPDLFQGLRTFATEPTRCISPAGSQVVALPAPLPHVAVTPPRPNRGMVEMQASVARAPLQHQHHLLVCRIPTALPSLGPDSAGVEEPQLSHDLDLGMKPSILQTGSVPSPRARALDMRAQQQAEPALLHGPLLPTPVAAAQYSSCQPPPSVPVGGAAPITPLGGAIVTNSEPPRVSAAASGTLIASAAPLTTSGADPGAIVAGPAHEGPRAPIGHNGANAGWVYDAALAARYASTAESFEPLTANNLKDKMHGICQSLGKVYGSMPFARMQWGTSILGTLVGLICAQTCRNSWSSIGYSNMQATFPGPNGEPDWDLVRRSRVQDLEVCIRHGPYYHRKAERIHALLQKAYDDFGEGTSFEALYSWPSEKVRSYLMGISGISGKSVACLLLYRMRRLAFAVDANVLRLMTRLGWLKKVGILPTEGLSISDRRAVIRIGLLLPPPSRRPAPITATLAQREARFDVVGVKLSVAAGSARVVLMVQPIIRETRLLVGKVLKKPPASLAYKPRATGGGKRRRCGSCTGCTTPNCGECAKCRDMPAFGGPGKMRQSCDRRRCLIPVLPPSMIEDIESTIAGGDAPELSVQALESSGAGEPGLFAAQREEHALLSTGCRQGAPTLPSATERALEYRAGYKNSPADAHGGLANVIPWQMTTPWQSRAMAQPHPIVELRSAPISAIPNPPYPHSSSSCDLIAVACGRRPSILGPKQIVPLLLEQSLGLWENDTPTQALAKCVPNSYRDLRDQSHIEQHLQSQFLLSQPSRQPVRLLNVHERPIYSDQVLEASNMQLLAQRSDPRMAPTFGIPTARKHPPLHETQTLPLSTVVQHTPPAVLYPSVHMSTCMPHLASTTTYSWGYPTPTPPASPPDSSSSSCPRSSSQTQLLPERAASTHLCEKPIETSIHSTEGLMSDSEGLRESNFSGSHEGAMTLEPDRPDPWGSPAMQPSTSPNVEGTHVEQIYEFSNEEFRAPVAEALCRMPSAGLAEPHPGGSQESTESPKPSCSDRPGSQIVQLPTPSDAKDTNEAPIHQLCDDDFRAAVAESLHKMPSAQAQACDRRLLGVPLAFGFDPFETETTGEPLPQEVIAQLAPRCDAASTAIGDVAMTVEAATPESATSFGKPNVVVAAKPQAPSDNAVSASYGIDASIAMNSEAWRSAPGSATLRLSGASKMYCRIHAVYHVCDWTRERAKQLAAAQNGGTSEVGNAAPASKRRRGGAGGSAVGDIEDIPKQPLPSIKRFSVRAQQYMQEILPEDSDVTGPLTAETAALHDLLYRAHVYMITHGAVICGDTPNCDQCPLQSSCEYGSLLKAGAIANVEESIQPGRSANAPTSHDRVDTQRRGEMPRDGRSNGMANTTNDDKLDGYVESVIDPAPPTVPISSPPHGDAAPDGGLSHEELAELAEAARGGRDSNYQLTHAREVVNEACAPRHEGDETPRLLLVRSIIGDYAKGRLLISPWSAFKGVFPMHGTYFFQNEVFEDESAGEVAVPLSSLGPQRPVYLGKSIEGVLRPRGFRELQLLFRHGYVCIRRFRSVGWRLLPLVLDTPRLLKYNAAPSGVALEYGLQQAPVASGSVVIPDVEMSCSGSTPTRCTPEGQEREVSAEEHERRVAARRRGLRLFSVYLSSGGALCMRETVWRKIVLALHPDRGGDVQAFQLVGELKRRTDLGEDLPMGAHEEIDDARKMGLEFLDHTAAALVHKLEADIRAKAAELGVPIPQGISPVHAPIAVAP